MPGQVGRFRLFGDYRPVNGLVYRLEQWGQPPQRLRAIVDAGIAFQLDFIRVPSYQDQPFPYGIMRSLVEDQGEKDRDNCTNGF